MKNRRFLAPLIGTSLIFFTASAHAGDVIKANNTTALNLTGSWATAVPTSTDVAVWNSAITGANSSAIGGSLSWQGIKLATGIGGDITIADSASANTLTLGSAGIDTSASNRKLIINSNVTLSSNQTWTTGAATGGNSIEIVRPSATAQTLDLGGFTLTKAGGNILLVGSGNTLTNGTINIDAGVLQLNSGSSRTNTVNSSVNLNVASGAFLRFANNSGSGGASVNSAAVVTVNNGGTLEVVSTNTTVATQSGKVTFNGSSTLDNKISTASSRMDFTGEMAVAGTLTWKESGATNATAQKLTGNLTGNGTVNFQNTSAVAGRRADWSGDNSGFTGTVNLNGGSGNRNLRLTTATAGSSSATWAPAAGNILEVDGVAVNLGTLNGAGTVTNSHATNVAKITVGSGAFSGAVTNGAPALGMAVTKTGSGLLAFTGANTYTGLTDIQGGTLSTTTLQTGGGAITVGDTASFALTQSANGSTFNSSTLTLGSAGGSKLILTGAAAPSVALITAPNFTVNGASTITLKGTPVNNMTLIDYTGSIGGSSGFGGLSLITPFRTSGTLSNDTTNTLVQLTSFAADTLKWQGNVSSVWNIDTTNTGAASGATANWKTTAAPSGAYYVEAGVGFVDSPVFDDTATGSTAVTLNTTVAPVGITFNNSSLAYSVSGAGAIAGTTSIVKNGSAALTLSANNSFNGGVQLNAGTLNVNNAGALGTGTLAIAAGTTLDNTSGSAKVTTNAQNWNGDFTFTGSNDLTLGTAAMNADRQVTVSGGNLTVGGITGAFGLTKAGAGTLAVGASSYSGATAINGGTLKSTSATAFSNTSSVTLANTAGVALDLNGINQTVNTITGGGATGGNIVLNGAVLTTGTASNNSFAGALVGAGGLTKQGAGVLTLTGDKTGYTGTTNVIAGTLDLGTLSGAFGTGNITGSNTVFVQGNGTTTTGITGGGSGIGARGGNFTVNVGGAGALINMNSGGTGGLGGFVFGSASSDSRVIVQNGVGVNNFNGSRNITVNTGTGTASAEISGVISGGGAGGISNIVKLGTGDLILSAANTYSGETAINAGKIVLGNNLALQNSPINTDNVGKIDATGFTTPSFGGLKGTANLSTMITGGYSGITTLTLNTVNNDAALTTAGKTFTTFGGVIADGAAGMNLVKSGGGTQTLNGVNTYTGSTTINGGTLALGASGSIDGTTGVSLGTNGTFDVSLKSGGYIVSNLSGSGTVKGVLTVSTQLAIGNSPGTSSFDSGLTLDSATYVYEMTGGASPGLGSADLGNVTGTLTITAGSILDLVELGSFTMGNKFTLFGYTTGISGTFDGLADGAEFSDDLANKWQIDYNDTTAGLNGGIGTSFVTITAVPEPHAALIGGLGLLALLRRRRN